MVKSRLNVLKFFVFLLSWDGVSKMRLTHVSAPANHHDRHMPDMCTIIRSKTNAKFNEKSLSNRHKDFTTIESYDVSRASMIYTIKDLDQVL